VWRNAVIGSSLDARSRDGQEDDGDADENGQVDLATTKCGAAVKAISRRPNGA
jgi:hypothetical protein